MSDLMPQIINQGGVRIFHSHSLRQTITNPEDGKEENNKYIYQKFKRNASTWFPHKSIFPRILDAIEEKDIYFEYISWAKTAANN